ncbi:ABC transporter ATP-binding protein [Burkholderia gladioli]|uniref:ABC transporter ATP-binding protein n=1 Tax=Burkholderia gladioli TaxID=28095 RepID=UPI00163E8635|nr:ABC transporter ATP-binding protein [Burkholderia gladioli]
MSDLKSTAIPSRREARDTLMSVATPEERWRYLRALAMTSADGLLGALPYAIAAAVVGLLLRGGASTAQLFGLTAFACVCPLLRIAIALSAQRTLFVEGYRLTARLRMGLLRHVLSLPLGALSGAFRADALARFIVNEMRWVEEFASFGVAQLSANLALFTSLVLCLALIEPRVALAVLVLIALGAGLLRVIGRRLLAATERQQAHLGEATQHVGEYAAGMPVLRVFAREGQIDREFARWNAALQGFYRAMAWRIGPLIFLLRGWLELSVAIVTALVCWAYGAGSLSDASFLVMLTLGLMTALPLEAILSQSFQEQAARRTVGRYREMLAEPSLRDGSQPAAAPAEIRLEHVSYAYGDGRRALDDVSVVLPAGITTLVVGPSGSGKSTLLQLIARYRDVDAGAIRIGKQDLRELPLAAHLARLSMVFQDPYLFQDSIAANLRLGKPDASLDELAAAARAARCESFIERQARAYDTPIAELARNLSGGEAQRLSIARALLKDAPIVLLDETTSALDADNDHAVREALASLLRGRTTVMVTHRLDSAPEARHIVVMEAGRVADCGTHRELLDRCTVYRELWQAWCRKQAWTLV